MKPRQGMILEAKRVFNVNGEECVFVGDTLTDMTAAKAGGIGLRTLTETRYGKRLMGTCICAPTTMPVQITHVDNDLDLNAIVPFVYARNLAGAVDWLLGCAN